MITRRTRACGAVCLLEPLWDQFSALLPVREGYAASHPLGCHRRRIPDRVVFEHVVLALVHGSGYERIASPGCSDRTIRRRVKQWADLGIAQSVHALALEAYDRVIGLALTESRSTAASPKPRRAARRRDDHRWTEASRG